MSNGGIDAVTASIVTLLDFPGKWAISRRQAGNQPGGWRWKPGRDERLLESRADHRLPSTRSMAKRGPKGANPSASGRTLLLAHCVVGSISAGGLDPPWSHSRRGIHAQAPKRSAPVRGTRHLDDRTIHLAGRRRICRHGGKL